MANTQVQHTLIPNSRGGQSLLYDGHKFRVKTRRRETVHWKCCKAGCPSTINTANNLITTYRNIHNHVPDPIQLKSDAILANLRQLVKVDHRPVPSIYQEEVNKLRTSESEDVLQTVPTLYSVDSSLYRARSKTLPPLPKQRQNIDLPDIYQQTSSGQNFLLHDEDDNKLLVFSTPDNIRHLATSDVYYCDGTFSMCPSLYYQIYSIHAFVHDKMFPLVYALLPDKKQTTYQRLFNILKQKATALNVVLQPTHIFTDFEIAAQNAIRTEFQCQVKGCMFHYRQAIWKGAQRFGLQAAFKTNPIVNQLVRRAAALQLYDCATLVTFGFMLLKNAIWTLQV